MRSRKEVQKDWSGLSHLVGTLMGIFLLLVVLAASVSAQQAVSQYTTLDNFADQLLVVAAQEGRAAGPAMDKRLRELRTVTGMNPSVSWDASWFKASSKTVQYGETITLTASYDTSMSVFGIPIPLHLSVTKTAASEKYWK